MYSKTTAGVTVTVEPDYLEDQSRPTENHYVWAYSITISNGGPRAVQLRTRHWKITDANGHIREIDGEGVVGEQPLINPGESFHYTSGAPLTTPGGIMAGSYGMETGTGEILTVEIPAFSLDSPHQKSMIN